MYLSTQPIILFGVYSPPGTDPGIYRCGLIPTSEQTGHKARPNTCNVSDTCAAKLAVKRTLSCFPCDQEGLPFVWKTQKFREDLKWNSSSPWKFSGKKVIPFEVLPFSRFYRNDLNFLYHLFALPVSGFNSRESEKFTGIL